jgi:hypothetical protein
MRIDARQRTQGTARTLCFTATLLVATLAGWFTPAAQAGDNAIAAAAVPDANPALVATPQPSAVGQGTLRKKVTNPALFTRGRMPEILAALRKQRAAVAVERAAILNRSGRPPGSTSLPAVQDMHTLNALSSNASIANTSNSSNAVNRPNAPSRPAGGAIVGSKLAANVTSISPPTRAAVTDVSNGAKEQLLGGGSFQSAVCHGPTIDTVNGEASGAIFSSDPQFNQYTIKGCGFGQQQGQARLFGPFTARVLNLQIEFWSDNAIIATLDPNLTGEPDQHGTVNLVIAPAVAPQVQMSGLNFYAVREPVVLPTFPVAWMHLAPVNDTAGSRVSTRYYSPANASPGTVIYQPGRRSDNCPEGLFLGAGGPSDWSLDVERVECGRIGTGTDTFDLTALPAGLEPYEFYFQTQDLTQAQCNDAPGSDTTYFDGSWNPAWTGNGNVIQITTAASTCHASGAGFGIGGTMGVSKYSLQIWLLRPRGVPLPSLP